MLFLLASHFSLDIGKEDWVDNQTFASSERFKTFKDNISLKLQS